MIKSTQDLYLIRSKVKTDIFKKIFTAGIILSSLSLPELSSQNIKTLNLETAIDLALQNNHLLNIKKLQVNEKEQKVMEDRIKYLPTVGIGGTYQYNTNLPSILIEQGRFGQLPFGTMIIPLPAIDEVIEVGKHNVYNAGVTLYQPVSQIGKINAGVKVSKTELQIAKREQDKAAYQVKQGVEKLYFGLLILQKKIEEAEIKLLLAGTKLTDAENALSAGKTTESAIYGLSAGVADEEQNLLKLRIEYDDYAADLIQVTGLHTSTLPGLQPVPADSLLPGLSDIDTAIVQASSNNYDLKIASLYNTKADFAIRAGRLSYLPDIGILGGYTYQEGTEIYPRNNTFIGASLKWNLQDVLSNNAVIKQRIFSKKQAEENLENTRMQVNKDIAKAFRKRNQAAELIKVASKVVEFRRADLKIQADRRMAGLNLESDLLTAKAAMVKAESDLFSAQMNYRIALSELEILTGRY